MSSDIFGFTVFKLFIVLNRKILSFDFFLVFFSLLLAHSWLLKALLDVSVVDGLLSCYNASILVMAILKFIAQVEFASTFIDTMSHLWRHFILLFVIIMLIVTMVSVHNLMFRSPFLSSKSKANGWNPIWIVWVGSPKILFTLWIIDVLILFRNVLSLGCTCERSLISLADFVVSLFH